MRDHVLPLGLVVIIVLLLEILRRMGRFLRQASDLMFAVKEWSKLGHDALKDTRRAAVDTSRAAVAIEHKTEAITSPADVMQAVAAVPDATAAKVVEALEHKAGDSGVFGPNRPPDTKGT